jgi:peptidoglycan/LPS O-acetylase OafA/YrhL
MTTTGVGAIPPDAAADGLAVPAMTRPGDAVGPTAQPAPRFRLDIQLLRALAILLVLAHHAHVPGVPGGFLGVDIFFVISGFLMTTLIDAGLEKRTFSFSGFFARRARRILPAAYATMVVTAVAAPFLLDTAEYRNFVAQLAGTFGFVANVVLWRQSDYFGSDAALKPLLHMWSLSIEEQFYLVLPVLLVLCAARLRLALVVLLSVGSFGLCAWFVRHSPSAAFYLLPTRAWELGLGSVVALLVRRGLAPPRPSSAARVAAGIVVVAVPLFATERGHPGLAALVACLATAVLLLPGREPGRVEHALRPLGAVGDRSYSLYLVHWPVFVFANNVYLLPVPQYVNLLLLLPCVLWMEAQYRMVEQPLRHLSMTRRNVALLIAVPVLTVGASAAFWFADSDPRKVAARAANTGLSARCDYSGAEYTARVECQTQAAAQTLVWGDSYAIALVPGFAATSPQGIVQATRTVCGPFVGLAPTNDLLYPRSWAESCIAFNRSVLAHIAAHPEIRTVVLSSALAQYVPGAEDRNWSMLVEGPEGRRVRPQQIEHLTAALARTVAEVRRLGRRVVLVAPPPTDVFDSARCLDRLDGGNPTIAPDAQCRYSRSSYVALRKPVLDFLARTRADQVVPVIALDDALCDATVCATQMDGVPLYRDAGHLSMPGAALLGTRMNWGMMARATAR